MRRTLFRKYLLLMGGGVVVILLASSSLAFWLVHRQNEQQLLALQHEKAQAGATRIELFLQGIEQQLAWAAQAPTPGQRTTLAARRIEYLRLLRQAPAVTELSWIDAAGREQLRLSRVALDQVGSGMDRSNEHAFAAGRTGSFLGPVSFRKGSEPYLTMALPAAGPEAGVLLADVNLKLVWDVVSRIRVGAGGVAYVVDGTGQLIAHPDIAQVLRRTDLAGVAGVAAALGGRVQPVFATGSGGPEVLSASAPVRGTGWHVIAELPRSEAQAPLRALVQQGLVVLALGLVLAGLASVLLARRLVRPIRALEAGAREIGAGRLEQRIEVRTGDELQALAEQFNVMSRQLQDSYANLEQRVAARTQELQVQRQRAESSSLAKSRFLAAASHDLRQPMHALGLYLATLGGQPLSEPARALLREARACAQTMDALFDALLDISKLDANVITPQRERFALEPLLHRITGEFAPQARAAGLVLRVLPCPAAVDTDPLLLERILRNLVSNALRYTHRGHVLVAARQRGGQVLLWVCDTGIGIRREHQALVFEEFYQVDNPGRDRARGLGLGLSIVRRLAQLLELPLSLRSRPGRGSIFRLGLPLAGAVEPLAAEPAQAPPGCSVLVVDDDAAVLHATTRLLQDWGCQVTCAASRAEALARLAAGRRAPDLLLCDWRLRGETGADVVEAIRDEFNTAIPAIIISGDAVPAEPVAPPVALLHKPVDAKLLQAVMGRMLAAAQSGPAAESSPSARAARTA